MMAKFNVEFDTKEKVLNVTIDGKPIDNVSSVEFYPQYDSEGFHGAITTVEKVDDEDMVKIMRVSANDGLLEGSSNLPKILANRLFRRKLV